MSGTIIDEFFIELGFRGDAAEKGLKQTDDGLNKVRNNAASTAADMEHRGDQAALFFTKMRNEALLLLSVMTAGVGIERFVKNTVSDMAKLGYTAENLNMPVEQLTAWQLAADKAGGSAQSITAAIAQANKEAAMIKAGKVEGVSEFNGDPLGYFGMGGRMSELQKGGLDILLEKSRILKEVFEKDPAKAAAVADSMGITPENFNLLKQGPGAVLALVKAQEQFTVTSAANAKEALELSNKVKTLNNEFDAVRVKILLELFPVFEQLLGKFKEFGDYVLTHKGEIAATVKEWADKIGEVAGKIDQFAQSIGGWKSILEALVVLKLGSMAADLFLFATGLGKIAAGLSAITAASGAGTALRAVVGVGAAAAGMMAYSGELNKNESGEVKKNAETPYKNESYYASDNGAHVLALLQAKGLSREQSIGVMANMWQESKYNPNAYNADENAVGIAQWHKSRQADFERLHGRPLKGATLEQQVDFAVWELNNTEKRGGDLLRKTGTPEEAAAVYSRNVERPGLTEEARSREADNRSIIAEQLSRLYPVIAKDRAQEAKNSATFQAEQMQRAAAIASSQSASNSVVNNNSNSDSKFNITINTDDKTAPGIAANIEREIKNRLNFQFDSGVRI